MEIKRIDINGRKTLLIHTKDYRLITFIGSCMVYVKFKVDDTYSDHTYMDPTGDKGTNYWMVLYAGPWYRVLTAADGDSTNVPKPIMVKKIVGDMIQWFKTKVMVGWDVLQVSGCNERLDILYHNLMPRYGFHNVNSYMSITDILIYLRPPDGLYPEAAWDDFMEQNGCAMQKFVPDHDPTRYEGCHSRLWWYWDDIKDAGRKIWDSICDIINIR